MTKSTSTQAPGLSPRVRGNPREGECGPQCTGSIPACAGEPSWRVLLPISAGVYPRVCGGTVASWVGTMAHRGLSPRVRGNPSGNVSMRNRMRVYPRVCGGTADFSALSALIPGLSPRVRGNPSSWKAICRISGLSPRVRGNQSCCVDWGISPGSIPACAGEPVTRSECRLGSIPACNYEGLSPRVRGNPLLLSC